MMLEAHPAYCDENGRNVSLMQLKEDNTADGPKAIRVRTTTTCHDASAMMALLTILSDEIYQDGGASLVVDLKESYVARPKQIDSLLVKSTGSKRLLTFLEMHGTIFSVDRQATPHFVKLLSNEYCSSPVLLQQADESLIDKREGDLKNKILLVFRKRLAKIARRDRPSDTKAVSIRWLLKECKREFHALLRASAYYQQVYSNPDRVHIVGSHEWKEQVLGRFQSFLTRMEGIEQNDSRVWLLSENDDDDSLDISHFALKLTELVQNDGATHVTLSLLLHRHEVLKRMLGGREFLPLVQKHADAFQNVIVTPQQNDVLLRPRYRRQGRLQVDETGLFSVASSRWGTAMANLLVAAANYVLDKPAEELTAVDLTASVGGLTLALAKASFAQVIAVEVDPGRAALCRENMTNHGFDHIVEVHTADAMDIIPNLAALCNFHPVFIIDPPWGGFNYKHEGKSIRMGSWLLEEVLEYVLQNMAPPIVIGLRLPVNFPVTEFLEGPLASQRDVHFHSISVRRLGTQLFAVLTVTD